MAMIRFMRCTAAVLLLFAAVANGDSITLKNGEKIEGKVLSETEAEITVQVRVTATILDERVIKKADIAKIAKVAPDLVAWPALNAMALGPDSLDASDYQRARAALRDFITSFPESQHAQAAKDKFAAFDAEGKRVEAGELKIDGEWISKEEFQRERVQIIGRLLFKRMNRSAAEGRLVEAMNTFVLLEKEAGGSVAFPDAVELTRQILPTLKTAAEQRRDQLKAQAEENKRRLANTEGPDRQLLERLQKKQAAETSAAVEAFERSGQRWMPLDPATLRSLASIISFATSEIRKVAQTDTEKMRKSISLAKSARAALDAKNIEKAGADLNEAKLAWSGNDLVKRLEPEVTAARKIAAAEKAAEKKAVADAARAARKATPAPTPVPAASAAVVDGGSVKKTGETGFLSSRTLLILVGVLGVITLIILKFFAKGSTRPEDVIEQ